MIRSPGAEPRDQVKRKRALQGCNHRRGITWWGLIRADVGSVGESTRSRAASSLGCCFGCCLSPTSDEKTPACLENPLPCFPCATQAHPLVVALYSRGSRPEFADAFLRQITTSNRDDFLSKARAGTTVIVVCASPHSASAVVHSLFRPCDTHLRIKLPASASRAGKFPRTQGNDFREMEHLTGCGRARSSKETREPSVVRRTLGTTAL